MLNIVIPMAGAGSRFAVAGYTQPKPLIPVNGLPMIQMVIKNLSPAIQHRFIFICQHAHIRSYDLERKFSDWSPGCAVVGLNTVTEGAACTVLAAEELLDNDTPLMIANSDQYVDVDINRYLGKISELNLDGLIMTMKANDPKWSYVGIDTNGLVSRVVEKVVISDEGTVGIYNFRRGRDFVNAAKEMIRKNLRVNNEFYVAPTYNQLIEKGAQVGYFNVGREGAGMYGLGTPADLEFFLKQPICNTATGRVS